MEDYLRVGVISNTHGIRGEVKVFPTTDEKERFDDLEYVFVDTGKEKIRLDIQNVKYFKNMVILKFKGFDDINEIEKYKGSDLLITREQAVPLEPGQFFLCDVIDSTVVEENGNPVGILTEVLTTAANDVFVVKMENGKEVLLPVIEDCVKQIDLEQKIVTVYLMPGLLD
ncbi:MAG: ribosome maturation factor RimM [Clostridiales bacterium]|nr:ribosome maturation factor RimM [Clostridiales bacterium]